MQVYIGNSTPDFREPFSKDSPDRSRRRIEAGFISFSDVVDALNLEPEICGIYHGGHGPRPYDPGEDGRFFAYLAWRCRKYLDLMEEVASRAPRWRKKWEEWDEREGTTWLRYELRKAAESAEEVWEPLREIPSSDDAKGGRTSSAWPLGTTLTGRVKLGERIGGAIKPPEQLVDGFLYAGKIHALNSEPGEGKTTAALWATLEVVRQGRPVLYLDAENGPALISERLRSMGADVGELDRLMHYHPSPELGLDPDSLASLAATVEEVGPALVVFDSLPDFLVLSGLNENDAGDVTRWILRVVQPLKERGIAVLLLDHVAKSAEGRGRYARGSGAKLAKCDAVWSLSQTARFDRGRVGELRLTRQKDREAFMPRRLTFAVGGTPDGLMFERTDGGGVAEGVDIGSSDPSDEITTVQRQALDALRERAGTEGVAYSQWKKGAGLASTTFDRARDALLRLGLVSHIKGHYHAINAEPPLDPHRGGSRGGSRGGNFLGGGGSTNPHGEGWRNADTYDESPNPHLPPNDPHGGDLGVVQPRTPIYPHPSLGGGGCGGWTGGADPEEASKETGTPVMDSRVPRKLAAYLANPPAELVARAEEVRCDPSRLKKTCCDIAFEVYSNPRLGAEIEGTVSAWIRGEYSPK